MTSTKTFEEKGPDLWGSSPSLGSARPLIEVNYRLGAGGPLLHTCFSVPNTQPPTQPPPPADPSQHPPLHHGEASIPQRPHPPSPPQFHDSPDTSTGAPPSEGNGPLMETFANTMIAIFSHGAPSPVTSSTLVAARTRSNDKAPEILPLMINVMGPQSPAPVHRPWTEGDMIAALTHLPDHTASGAKFAAALTDFCAEFQPTVYELRRLLLRKMGLTDFAKIRAACEGYQELKHPDWNHEDNATYRVKLNTIGAAIAEAFPRRVDMSRVMSCKMRSDESVADYYHRLLQIFNEYSGLDEPANRGDVLSTWEVHLRHCFLDGLLPAIKAAVEFSCIGIYHGARLAKVKRHAEHAQVQLQRKKEKEDEKRQKQLHLAQLAMLQAVAEKPHQYQPQFYQQHRGRGRGRRRFHGYNQHLGYQQGGECFYCGKMGHWARDCPE